METVKELAVKFISTVLYCYMNILMKYSGAKLKLSLQRKKYFI
jgi:hypothetical protein